MWAPPNNSCAIHRHQGPFAPSDSGFCLVPPRVLECAPVAIRSQHSCNKPQVLCVSFPPREEKDTAQTIAAISGAASDVGHPRGEIATNHSDVAKIVCTTKQPD